MTYTSEQRRAYYLSKREQHLQYSREYVNSHKDKYLAYYKAYSKMKREFYKVFVYTELEGTETGADMELPKAPSRTKKFKINNLKWLGTLRCPQVIHQVSNQILIQINIDLFFNRLGM